jgi:hypothetical protein
VATEIRRENADDGSYAQGECGCQIWTQNDQFIIDPCSLTCENYLYAVAQTKRAGNPLHYRYKES